MTARKLLVSTKPVSVHQLLAASLSIPFVVKSTLQVPYRSIADRLQAQRGGNSAGEFRGADLRKQCPKPVNPIRPKPIRLPTGFVRPPLFAAFQSRGQARELSQARIAVAPRLVVSLLRQLVPLRQEPQPGPETPGFALPSLAPRAVPSELPLTQLHLLRRLASLPLAKKWVPQQSVFLPV